MKSFKQIYEAAYAANIGFEEMVKFYKKASKSEEAEMEKILRKSDFDAFKKLIAKVLGVKLK